MAERVVVYRLLQVVTGVTGLARISPHSATFEGFAFDSENLRFSTLLRYSLNMSSSVYKIFELAAGAL